MASSPKKAGNAAEIDRLALAFVKEPGSKLFIPLAEEYGKAGMWEEAAAILEDGLKTYPGFITAMVALGRAYEQMNQAVKAKAILEEAVKLSPDNLRAHRTLAKLYAAQGSKDAVIRSCYIILAINPRDQEALSLLAGVAATTAHVTTPSPERSHEKSVKAGSPDSGPLHDTDMIRAVDGAMPAMNDKANGLLGSVPHAEESLVPTAAIQSHTSREVGNPVITQLERWLQTIQTRRRYPSASSRSHA
jgi:tetratricopeptide (TPR) repeat protein